MRFISLFSNFLPSKAFISPSHQNPAFPFQSNLTFSFFLIVEGGHRAILFDRARGVLPTTIQEGTHFLIPFWQRPIIFDVRAKPRSVSTSTGSKDMQTISLTLRLLHRPDYDRLSVVYQNLGLDYDDRVLPSVANEVLKAIVAQFDASELITQRELVK